MYTINSIKKLPLAGEGAGLINIEPFHGSLGFLPKSQVFVSLKDDVGPGTEIAIRPYRSNGELMLLRTRLRDGVGVVARLVSAVADLKINIVNLVSTTVRHERVFHDVFMVLDWETSLLRHAGKSSPIDRRRYARFQPLFDIDKSRNIQLFRSIVHCCSNQLHFSDVPEPEQPNNRSRGGMMPVLSMLELDVRPDPQTAVVEAGKNLYSVNVRLSAQICEKIASRSRTKEAVCYLSYSDPETRTFRIFIHEPTEPMHLYHVAFFHANVSGAFETILKLLERIGCDLQSSLVRSVDVETNVMEAIIKSSDPLHGDGSEEKSIVEPSAQERFLRKLLGEMMDEATASDCEALLHCHLRIGMPMHPKRKGSIEPLDTTAVVRQRLSDLAGTDGGGASEPDEPVSGILPEYLAAAAENATLRIWYPEQATLYAERVGACLTEKQLERFEHVSIGRDFVPQPRCQNRFCRNVLLWFAPGGDGKAESILTSMLSPVGEEETPIVLYPDDFGKEWLFSLPPKPVMIPYSYQDFENSIRKRLQEELKKGEPSDSLLNIKPPEPVSPARDQRRLFDPSQSKIKNVLNFISTRRDGVTAAEILDAFQKEGLPLKRTYLSSVLVRLREDGDIGISMREGKHVYRVEAGSMS